ncbi:MAG: lipopolysaccharide core heptose(II) kinase RfaY [Fusobacteriaceae bacterium]
MIIISEQKRSKVIFNKKDSTFIKFFYPKLAFRLKYLFHLRSYPGYNFKNISNLLNSLGFNTPEIIQYSKYMIKTKPIEGVSLEQHFSAFPNDKTMEQKIVNFITTIFKNKIYSGDLHFGNFLVSKNELYILDLEDYRHVKFFKRSDDEFLRRLKGKIPPQIFKAVLERLK